MESQVENTDKYLIINTFLVYSLVKKGISEEMCGFGFIKKFDFVLFSLFSPNVSRPSTPKSDSELFCKGQPEDSAMLWSWGELPQAAKVEMTFKPISLTHVLN